MGLKEDAMAVAALVDGVTFSSPVDPPTKARDMAKWIRNAFRDSEKNGTVVADRLPILYRDLRTLLRPDRFTSGIDQYRQGDGTYELPEEVANALLADLHQTKVALALITDVHHRTVKPSDLHLKDGDVGNTDFTQCRALTCARAAGLVTIEHRQAADRIRRADPGPVVRPGVPS